MLDIANARRPRSRQSGHRRRVQRDHCDYPTLLSHGHHARIDAQVADISAMGCSIVARGEFRRGDPIRILLPLVGDRHAHVAWSLNGCFGCWFDREIDEERYPLVLAAMKTLEGIAAAR